MYLPDSIIALPLTIFSVVSSSTEEGSVDLGPKQIGKCGMRQFVVDNVKLLFSEGV